MHIGYILLFVTIVAITILAGRFADKKGSRVRIATGLILFIFGIIAFLLQSTERNILVSKPLFEVEWQYLFDIVGLVFGVGGLIIAGIGPRSKARSPKPPADPNDPDWSEW